MRKLFIMWFALLVGPGCVTNLQGPALASRSSAGHYRPLKTQVLVVGTFHFAYPNLDAHRTGPDKQIDVLAPTYQRELKQLTQVLARFRPTHIAVEKPASAQGRLDSLYAAYGAGHHDLTRGEEQQIGFRLARLAGLPGVWGVDAQGNYFPSTQQLLADTARSRRFEAFYALNPDSALRRAYQGQYALEDRMPAQRGLVATLIELNRPANLLYKQGSYLTGAFKYEEHANDYAGTDFETSRWYSRNLRIFRNLQRVPVPTGGRLLVIIGAGHAGLLNYLLGCSPEFELVSPEPYLRKSLVKKQKKGDSTTN